MLETSLRQGQKDDLSTDLIFTGGLTVGGVILGLLPSLGALGTAGICAGAIGLVLISIGIAAKIVKDLMNGKSRTIAEPAILKNERLLLGVVQDDDIGRYPVFCTTSVEPTTVSTAIKRIHWFPDKLWFSPTSVQDTPGAGLRTQRAPLALG